MAENKQYITHQQENGSVQISEEVIATIALNALKEVEGVVTVGTKLNVDLSNIKNWVKALKITIGENNEIGVDCSITVAYGQSVIQVAKAAQDAIAVAIENMTGVKTNVVNINVCGIARQ